MNSPLSTLTVDVWVEQLAAGDGYWGPHMEAVTRQKIWELRYSEGKYTLSDLSKAVSDEGYHELVQRIERIG